MSQICKLCGLPIQPGHAWMSDKGSFHESVIFDCVQNLKAEVERLLAAIARTAAIADTGSAVYCDEFGFGGDLVAGWRVAERMRTVLVDAVKGGA